VARHLEDMEPVVEAINVQPKQKGCWGRFCQTIKRIRTGNNVAPEAGGRKTKRLRKKYKKTRNIKKSVVKKNKKSVVKKIKKD
jgi:hypothetical protein